MGFTSLPLWEIIKKKIDPILPQGPGIPSASCHCTTKPASHSSEHSPLWPGTVCGILLPQAMSPCDWETSLNFICPMSAATYLAVCPIQDRNPSFMDGVQTVRNAVGGLSGRKWCKGENRSLGILNVAFYTLFQTDCWFGWGGFLLILLFPLLVWKQCFEFVLLE